MSAGIVLRIEDAAARRRGLRGMALLLAGLTAVGLFLLSGSFLVRLLAVAVLGLALPAARRPGAIPVFVGVGQLALILLLAGLPEGDRWLLFAPLLGLVAAAESFSACSGLRGAVPRLRGGFSRNAVARALLAGTVFLVVLFVGDPFAPSGPMAAATVVVAGAFLLRILLRG